MHANCVPSSNDLMAMVLASDIVDRRLKGGYLCMAKPGETDGGNLVPPDTWLAYIGKGTGQQGIFGRVSQHQNKVYRVKNPSTHYKTVYGDSEFARLSNSSLPTEPSAIYYVLFELPLDVQEEGTVYRKVAKVPANKTHAFLGLNVATGLENFGYNGPSTIPQAGPSNNPDAGLGPSNGLSERDKADLAFYKSYLSKCGYATNESMRKRNLKQLIETGQFNTQVSIATSAVAIYFPRIQAGSEKRVRIYFNRHFYPLVGIPLNIFNTQYNECKILGQFTFKDGIRSREVAKWSLTFEFIQEGYSTLSVELDPRKPKFISPKAVQDIQGYIDLVIAGANEI